MSDKNDVVIIKLDKERELRFGHRALKKLGALTGKNIDNLDDGDFDLEELEKMYYCGLFSDANKNGEKLELSDMEDLLDHAPMHVLMSKMQEALSNAMGGSLEIDPNLQRIAQKKKPTKKK